MKRMKEILNIKPFNEFFISLKDGCLRYTGPQDLIMYKRHEKVYVSIDQLVFPEIESCKNCRTTQWECPEESCEYQRVGRTCGNDFCYNKEHCFLFKENDLSQSFRDGMSYEDMSKKYGISVELAKSLSEE